MMGRMGIYSRLGSRRISTRQTRMTITVAPDSLRILIRRQGWGVCRPNPMYIILTSHSTMPRMAKIPRLSRSTRHPRRKRMDRAASITSSTRHHILTRLEVTDARTRPTRMVGLDRRRIFARG